MVFVPLLTFINIQWLHHYQHHHRAERNSFSLSLYPPAPVVVVCYDFVIFIHLDFWKNQVIIILSPYHDMVILLWLHYLQSLVSERIGSLSPSSPTKSFFFFFFFFNNHLPSLPSFRKYEFTIIVVLFPSMSLEFSKDLVFVGVRWQCEKLLKSNEQEALIGGHSSYCNKGRGSVLKWCSCILTDALPLNKVSISYTRYFHFLHKYIMNILFFFFFFF